MNDTEIKIEVPTIMDHNKHRIEITKAWYFMVNGPELKDTIFPSIVQAREAIDAAMERKAKIKAQKFSKIVMASNGELITILGFTRQDGSFKTAGDVKIDRGVYPNVPWIKELLAECYKVSLQYGALSETLREYEVRPARIYRGMSPDDYAQKLAQFEQEINEAERKAFENDPSKR